MENPIITVYGTEINLARDAINIVYDIETNSDIERMFMYARDAIIFANIPLAKTNLEGKGYIGMVDNNFVTHATLESGHTLVIQAPVLNGTLLVKEFVIGELSAGTLSLSEVTRNCLSKTLGALFANSFQDYLVTLKNMLTPAH